MKKRIENLIENYVARGYKLDDAIVVYDELLAVIPETELVEALTQKFYEIVDFQFRIVTIDVPDIIEKTVDLDTLMEERICEYMDYYIRNKKEIKVIA